MQITKFLLDYQSHVSVAREYFPNNVSFVHCTIHMPHVIHFIIINSLNIYYLDCTLGAVDSIVLRSDKYLNQIQLNHIHGYTQNEQWCPQGTLHLVMLIPCTSLDHFQGSKQHRTLQM